MSDTPSSAQNATTTGPSTATPSSTSPPRFRSVRDTLTLNRGIPMFEPLDERERIERTLAPMSERTERFWNMEPLAMQRTPPFGLRLLVPPPAPRQNRSSEPRNPEMRCSTPETSITFWTRCSHCGRMHLASNHDLLPNSVCQLKLMNGYPNHFGEY